MILSLHPDTPQARHLEHIAEILQRDGVIAYPTDTLFGLGCLVSRKKAVDRIQAMKGRDPKKPMSILCADMEMLCRYTRHLDTPTFRLLKQMFPGPYTAVLRLPAAKCPATSRTSRRWACASPTTPSAGPSPALLGEPIITTSCNACRTKRRCSTPPGRSRRNWAMPWTWWWTAASPWAWHSTIVDLSGEEPLLVGEGAGPWPL